MSWQVKLVRIAIYAVLGFYWGTQCDASIIHARRAMDSTSVNVQSSDSSVRHDSYIGALKTVFPEINNAILGVSTELYDSSFGYLIQFNQSYRGLHVLNASASILVLPNGDATFSDVNVHDSIGLPDESFLKDADDQTALLAFVKPYCQDFDSIEHVWPIVYPVQDSSSGAYTYYYALEVFRLETEPGRVLNWANGDVLEEMVAIGLSGTITTQYKVYGQDGPVETRGVPILDVKYYNLQSQQLSTGTNTDGYFVFSEVISDNDFWLRLYGTDTRTFAGDNDRFDLRWGGDAGQTFYWRFPAVSNQFYWEADAHYMIEIDPEDYGDDAKHWDLSTQLIYANLSEIYYSDQIGPNPWDPPTHQRYPVRSVPRHDDNRTCWTVRAWDVPSMGFGSYPNGTVRWAQWRDYTYHEFAHAFQIHATQQNVPNEGRYREWERAFVWEAMADYQAACRAEDRILAQDCPGGERDIAPNGRVLPAGYESDPNFLHNHNNLVLYSKALSGALWDFRRALELHPTRYFTGEDALGQAMHAAFLIPAWAMYLYRADGQNATLANYAQRLMEVCVHDGNEALANAMGHALWMRGIPSGSPSLTFQAGNPQTSSTSGLEPSNSSSMAIGQYGTYVVFADDGEIRLGWLRTGQTQWWISTVNSGMLDGISPCLSLRQNGTVDELYVAWLDEQDRASIPFIKFVVTGSEEQSDFAYDFGQTLWANVNDPDEEFSCITVVANSTYPVVLAGLIDGSNTGAVCWIVSNDGNQIDHQSLPAIVGNGAPTTSVSAYAVEDSPYMHFAWISENKAYHTCGHFSSSTPMFDTWTTVQRLTPETDVDAKQNISVAYSYDVQGVVAAWQELNTATSRWDIGWNRAHYIQGSSVPSFSATPYYISMDDCGNLRAPSLYPFTDNESNVPSGSPRLGLAYERTRTGDIWEEACPSLMFRGLAVNESNPESPSGWTWTREVFLDRGRTPSVYTATTQQGYRLAYLESDGSSPWDVIVDHINLYDGYVSISNEDRVYTVASAETLYTPLAFARRVVVNEGGILALYSVHEQGDEECAERQITLPSGGSFTVEDGSRLVIWAQDNNPIRMATDDSASSWSGIKVEKGGSLDMRWVNMYDTDSTCVSADQPYNGWDCPLLIIHSYFDGKKLVDSAQALRIIGIPEREINVEDLQIDSLAEGATGLYLYDCSIYFQDVTVNTNYRAYNKELDDTVQVIAAANSYIQQVSGKFLNCVFTGPSLLHGILLDGESNTPVFQCCLLEDLAPINWGEKYNASIFVMEGSSPVFGYDDAANVANAISDSCPTLMYMCGKGVLPIIDNPGVYGPGGLNDWYQRAEDSYYIYWDESQGNTYSAQDQYWYPKVDNAYFYPTGQFDLSGAANDPWGLCGSQQGLYSKSSTVTSARGRSDQIAHNLDDLQADRTLFRTALAQEIAGQYVQAQAAFRVLATGTISGDLRWLAITHVVSTERHINSGQNNWIPALIDSAMQLQSQDYSTTLRGNRLLAAYYTDRDSLAHALGLCTNLLTSGLTFNDSILVALDVVGIQMLLDSSESGNLDADALSGVPFPLRASSVQHAINLQRQLLGVYGTGINAANRSVIPSTYRLYQNYPNPFNPNTEIQFDLPEMAKVQIKIFNTLGQEVATLVDEVRPAGVYRIMWDSKSVSGVTVASGVYVYQIKAGNFVDSKKMVLIR